jgi:hypothetical protein
MLPDQGGERIQAMGFVAELIVDQGFIDHRLRRQVVRSSERICIVRSHEWFLNRGYVGKRGRHAVEPQNKSGVPI